MNNRRFVPDAAPIDTRTISGAAAAVVVSMVNKTSTFDIGNPEHVQAVADAIEVIVPKFCDTLANCQARDQYAE